MKITKEAFYDLIEMERNVWDEQHHSDEKWLATAIKKLGKVSKAFLEENEVDFLKEIVQFTALIHDWVASRGFKANFYNLIQLERDAQEKKWGPQHHSNERWLAITVEEVGEVSEAFQEKGDTEFLKEITQVAAVLENWVTSRAWYKDGREGND